MQIKGANLLVQTEFVFNNNEFSIILIAGKIKDKTAQAWIIDEHHNITNCNCGRDKFVDDDSENVPHWINIILIS